MLPSMNLSHLSLCRHIIIAASGEYPFILNHPVQYVLSADTGVMNEPHAFADGFTSLGNMFVQSLFRNFAHSWHWCSAVWFVSLLSAIVLRFWLYEVIEAVAV